MTWETATLGELCDIQIGKTPARDESKYWGQGYPWLSISDMNQGRQISKTKETITEIAIKECRCRLIPANTLLMSFKLSIGKVGFNQIPIFTNEAIAALFIKSEEPVLKLYLYWALQYVDLLQYVDKAAKGNTLNKKKLNEIKIPLPPLAEQQRIAAILDKADELRAKRRTALDKLDTLLQATFLHMFGDPVTNPMGWEVVLLGDLGADKKAIVDGPFGSAIDVNTDYSDSGDIPVIRTKNVNDFRFKVDDLKYITKSKFEDVKRSEVLPGDVILTKVGTIGNVCIFPDTFDRAVLSTTGSCRIRVNPQKINNIFLLYYLHNYKSEMLRIASAGVQAFLNMKHIKSFKVPLPNIELQTNFSKKERQINAYKKYHEEAFLKLDSLFHTLQQRAFKGEL